MNRKNYLTSVLTIALVMLTLSGFAQGHPASWFTQARIERNWRHYQRQHKKEQRARLAKEKKVKRYDVYGSKDWGYKAKVSVYTTGQTFKPLYAQLESGEAFIETNKAGVYIDTSAVRKIAIRTTKNHTVLNISEFKEDSVCYIVVYEGEVDILQKGTPCGLMPGQYVIFKGDSFEVENLPLFDVKVKSDQSWLTGTYDFVNKPLYLLINRVARTNHFTVTYARKPKNRVTGSIFADYHMLSNVGSLHSSVGGFGYSVDEAGKTATIY